MNLKNNKPIFNSSLRFIAFGYYYKEYDRKERHHYQKILSKESCYLYGHLLNKLADNDVFYLYRGNILNPEKYIKELKK